MAPKISSSVFKKRSLLPIYIVISAIFLGSALFLTLKPKLLKSPNHKKQIPQEAALPQSPTLKSPEELEKFLREAKEHESTISAQFDRSYASNPIILDKELGKGLVNLIIGVSDGTDKVIYGLIKPGKEGQTTVSYRKKSGGFATEKEFKPDAEWYKENIKPGQSLYGILFLPGSPFKEGEIKLPKSDKIEIRYPQRLIFLLEDE